MIYIQCGAPSMACLLFRWKSKQIIQRVQVSYVQASMRIVSCKLVRREASSEESRTTKICTDEQKLHTEAQSGG
jgi:hypothetical protein